MKTTLKLHAFPTGDGMFNMSPFCCKADILFKIADMEYEPAVPEDFTKFSKAKLPVLEDSSTIIEDSEMIRQHLENKFGVNLNGTLSTTEQAMGHALCRMVEERTRYGLLYFRWHTDAGWAQTRAIFFANAPSEVAETVRSQVRQTLHLNGFSRHSEAEIKAFLHSDLEALSIMLGEEDWFFSDSPTYIDACVFALLANLCASPIKTWANALVHEFPNLEYYVMRGMQKWYPHYCAKLRSASD
ncbi:glutathione S-transferase family protein [Kordiimonas sp.]|uniref:glutathione S-transferase family protein n=1 Tax=Kordiimonas sp. TaxID=1970157 RepID=UPI003A94E31B